MRRGLSVLGGIGLGVVLSQFPEYAQQYTQRLGGAVDELRIITERFDRDAAAGGLTRESAIEAYRASGQEFLAGQGETMALTFTRFAELSGTLERVRGATPFERFNMLPQFFDTEIGGRTLDNFQPAVPVTTEGFLYAGAGVLIGYFLVSVLFTLATLPFRRRRHVIRPTA